jgi:hypothetical protein
MVPEASFKRSPSDPGYLSSSNPKASGGERCSSRMRPLDGRRREQLLSRAGRNTDRRRMATRAPHVVRRHAAIVLFRNRREISVAIVGRHITTFIVVRWNWGGGVKSVMMVVLLVDVVDSMINGLPTMGSSPIVMLYRRGTILVAWVVRIQSMASTVSAGTIFPLFFHAERMRDNRADHGMGRSGRGWVVWMVIG